ncbi:MAG: hypothetical protein ACE5LC_00285 [Candidatus Aminicenantales bacterium]
MQVKKFLVITLFLALAGGICLAQEKITRESNESREKRTTKMEENLVRKELLTVNPKKLKPPKRDIFSPQRGNFSLHESRPINQEEVKRKAEQFSSLIEENSSPNMLDIVYLGYIIMEKKMTALIVFEDETFAVQEGEYITQDIRISKVLPSYIEVEGPGKKKTRFSLEGEGQ